MKNNDNKALVLLPTVLALGFVVVSIGLTGLFIVFTLNRSNYAIRLSNSALAAAQAGIKDANLRIIRNPNWLPVGCNSSNPLDEINRTYSLDIESYKVYVCVEKVGDDYIVNALGKARVYKKQLKAIFDKDPITNQIRTQSIYEIQF